MKNNILDILFCPNCHGRLVIKNSRFFCPKKHTFMIKRDTPVMTRLDPYLEVEAKAWQDQWKKGVSKRALDAYKYNMDVFKQLGYWEESGAAARQIPSENTWTVLDVGCGNGYSTSNIKGKLVVGVDLSEEQMIKATKKFPNAKYVVGDIRKLPFKSGVFDLVVAINIFHHIENPKIALNEIYRVLKKGGKLISVDPNLYNPIGFIGRGLYKFLNLKRIFPTFPQFALGDRERQFSKKQYYHLYEESPFLKYSIQPHRAERILFFATILFPFLSKIPGYKYILIAISKLGNYIVKQKPFDRFCYFWIGEANK